ncbi:hypothetical protein ACVW1A_004989 [Bradyrhizobium sp. LB1.3]
MAESKNRSRHARVWEIGTAVSLVLFGLAWEPILFLSASLIAGVSWIAVLAGLNRLNMPCLTGCEVQVATKATAPLVPLSAGP